MKAQERFQANVPVEFHSDNAVKHKALLDNIGTGGMCFNSVRYLAEGRDIFLKVEKNNRILETKGTVAWCKKNSNHYIVGVKFEKELSDSDIAGLKS